MIFGLPNGKSGDKKEYKIFAWIPVRLSNKTILWLESVHVMKRYDSYFGWETCEYNKLPTLDDGMPYGN